MNGQPDFSFSVVSCLHFGGLMRAWNSYKDTYALMSHVATLRPDLLIFNGSEVHLTPMKSDTIPLDNKAYILRRAVMSEQYVENTRQIIDQMAKAACESVFYVPSENSIPHFIKDNDPVFDAANRAFLRRAPGRYYAFEQKGCLFICLDSEADSEARGRISGPQLRFLEETAAQAKDFRHVFCFIHLSAWRNDCQQEAQWFETAHPLLKKAGVSHVFGACLHTYQHEQRDGLEYITSGSCGNNIDPPFSHFLFIEVFKDEVRVNVVWSGFPLFFPMTLRLEPQVEFAFIKKLSEYYWSLDESEINAYQEAVKLLRAGRLNEAQRIWSSLRYFPCINPRAQAKAFPTDQRQEHILACGYPDRTDN